MGLCASQPKEEQRLSRVDRVTAALQLIERLIPTMPRELCLVISAYYEPIGMYQRITLFVELTWVCAGFQTLSGLMSRVSN
jgi:hypothetical protein